jgi:hypothetical protein
VKALKLLVNGLFLSAVLLAYSETFGANAAGGLTRTNSGGGITAKVTYVHAQEADEARFEVVLDTHSVDLDAYDLTALSVLRDDTGKTYQAIRVENKGSGHHREVTIVFPKPASAAKRLELVIKDIAGIKERTFLWDI